MNFLETLKGKKSVIINGLLILTGVLAYIFPDAPVPSMEDLSGTFDLGVNAVAGVLGIVGLILRAVTTTSIFKSE